ncbi:hypothetical protein RIF29_06394 [Crotalaria pallida]|uniref:Uncharacterized protein n=1 Tax=Crotalaria pallida TaxID=3830 RepID=A0AAN9PAA9_CROPI
MRIGADRLCMPSPSIDQFINAIKQIVVANKRWVPPPGKGSLYIRPLLIGTRALLGVAPAPDFTFLIYCSPVNFYHKDPVLNWKVEDKLYRAIPGNGGTGEIKSVTNYAPKYGLQLFEHEYPPFIINHEKTKTHEILRQNSTAVVITAAKYDSRGQFCVS